MIPNIPIIVPLYSHYILISMVCFMGIPLYYYYIWHKIYGWPPRQHWAATASGNGKRNSEVSLRRSGVTVVAVVTVVTVSLQIILKIFRVFKS